MFNAVTFLLAAILETQIKAQETHMGTKTVKFNFQKYKMDFKEGIKYIKEEKGMLVITLYFTLTMFASSASSTVILPFFKEMASLGVQAYTIVMAYGVIGRLIGGIIHYRIKLPMKHKFTIAIFVYFVVTIIEGTYLYTPYGFMTVLSFVTGILGVTSYNIRISVTQNYVSDIKRGRFNGIFQMSCTLGMIVGQLLSGAMAEFISGRKVLLLFMSLNFLGVIFIMFRGRNYVKPIYNREV